MAVKTREEILTALSARIGDDNSDDAIALIEDVTDTLADAETKAKGDGTDWKAKFEENDKEWRTRYKERFMNSVPDDHDLYEPEPEPEPKKVKTFEELFSYS